MNILPDLVLQSRINCVWQESGIDSLDMCEDKTWFKQYPHNVVYQYNNRGFRDNNWPNSTEELSQSIWCVGDSFTVGLGSPVEHTWPCILQNSVNTKTINVSMDGASNNWIARRCADIKKSINPKTTVVCWSHTHRRELAWHEVKDQIEQEYFNKFKEFYNAVKAPKWPDITDIDFYNNLDESIRLEVYEHCTDTFYFNNLKLSTDNVSDDELRKLHHNNTTDEEDFKNFINCIQQVEQDNTNIIHCTIPEFCPKDWEEKYIKELSKYQYIGPTVKLDLARDGHHFDIKTSQNLVERITNFL